MSAEMREDFLRLLIECAMANKTRRGCNKLLRAGLNVHESVRLLEESESTAQTQDPIHKCNHLELVDSDL